MKILVTGAKGMVGTALVNQLKVIRDYPNQTRANIRVEAILEYDVDSSLQVLEAYCKEADFVFHLAGVIKPDEQAAFMSGNLGFSQDLIKMLKKYKNKAPIMFSSTIQASLIGRYGQGDYGRSKKACEDLFFSYAKKEKVKVAVYRFPNVMGHSRPNYNSAVSTFCHAVANDLDYRVYDRNITLELLHIDDLVDGLLDLLEGKEVYCQYDGLKPILNPRGPFCLIPNTHHVSLGDIVDLLEAFKENPSSVMESQMVDNAFAKKLWSLYLSYVNKVGKS